ncbi:MAG: hypothetical protein R3C59_13505 [Planctomycetaceae bacterium]
MSELHAEIAGSPHLPTAETPHGQRPAINQRSRLEQFLDSFFQERNIKWMLVVGAAIVFGSSLMLVSKAWPSWPNALKFLTILGYTGIIFVSAEVCRKRLHLSATYRVLHSLTLLLLPVCFLALQWLTSGTATQAWNLVTLCGLMLPATAFLWFAGSRILDHLLRGRQTTFLISFCTLCVAGAIPAIHSPVAAFAFMTICWAVFSAGVLKVNRHTFWLAENRQLPRIFGFLPIAMLGLQFSVLMGTKAISAIPVQWTGFGCVMMAATVLLTARTVADVFRQRTGNLVRPLPWHIVVPIFSGLVLTALGLALSFRGFSYVGPTTYAVIPTAIVAALLMWAAARETRHPGFVWAGMICAAIAYQCCPALFADVIQTLKQSTAAAINRERVPFSLYGITYLPLLAAFAIASRGFANRGESEFSRPLKHFVTVVGLTLFAVALTDHVSLFFVSLANTGASLAFAVLFQDRRYVLPALAGLVLATGVAIPALNSMQYTDIGNEWVATALACLAVLLTATRLPDRILQTIPESSASHHACLIKPASTLGCVLAIVTAAHWVSHSIVHFSQQMTQAAVLQYCALMVAFVLYTLRNPRYLSGACFWSMTAFASVRWAIGSNVPTETVLAAASMIAAATSLAGLLWLKLTEQIASECSLRDLRIELGIDSQTMTTTTTTPLETPGGWMRQAQAFVVPLCDLSLVILSCLAVVVHLPQLLLLNLSVLSSSAVVSGGLWLSTSVTVLWLAVAAMGFRSRLAGIAATMALPLLVTAAMLSSGMVLAAAWCCVIWAAVQGTILVLNSNRVQNEHTSSVKSAVSDVSSAWLQVLLIGSCLFFAPVLRLMAVIAIGCFAYVDRREMTASRAGYLAVLGNIQCLLLVGAVGGCHGFVMSVLLKNYTAAIPLVLTSVAISVAVFDFLQGRLEPILTQTWTAILRTGFVVLSLMSLGAAVESSGWLAIMLTGFAIAVTTEVVQAVRRQQETFVWSACCVAGFLALFLSSQGILTFGAGISQYVLLGLSIVGLSLAHLSKSREHLAVIHRPMNLIGQTLPMLVAGMAVVRELSGPPDIHSASNALALMLSAGIYFQQAMVTRHRSFALMAAAIMNVGVMLLFRSLHYTALEFYLVPVGLSVLAFAELLKKELPATSHDPLRYIGALTILVSPVFEVLGGSWGHMLTLMVLSVLVILASIGLRIRVLVYAGSAFLLADLVAMVVHTTITNPVLLWVGGVALGIGVIVLAAVCENHREKLLARIRFLSAELATWN